MTAGGRHFLGLVCALPRGLERRLYERRGMLLEQTAAEEDLSAPGSKSVLISVNQCHHCFYVILFYRIM